MAIKKLNSAESWEKVYQVYEQVNFTSYDFDTVRESLIEYMRHYYPEDFDDYVTSSEMIMLAEIFAYSVELIAYRVDMGMHENTIVNAERKQSILRLAKLISYNASRNLPARGLVKVNSVSTSETIIDSQGNDLANRVINWNDQNNPLWKEQFFLIMNRLITKPFGQPSKSYQVDDVAFQLYSLDNDAQSFINSVYGYSVVTNSDTIPMEIVSADIDESGPFEKYIDGTTNMNIMYTSDGLGDGSDLTGFLFYTKQGLLTKNNYQFDVQEANKTLDITVPNINNTDVWVNKIDDNGAILERWNRLDNINSQNIHFNTSSERQKYEIETLENDSIRIIFGDGDFSEIPLGNFEVWFRQSINSDVVIQKNRVIDEALNFSYTSNFDVTETSSMTFSLVSTLQNSSTSEDIEHIRRTAPSTYYSQNRMVNGQDYNSLLLKDSSILKLKAINRTFAGQPKFIEWNDASGNYQNVKIFGDDLSLYQDLNLDSVTSTISSKNLIDQVIEPLLKKAGVQNAITSTIVIDPLLEGVISNVRNYFIQEDYLKEKDEIQGRLDGFFYNQPTAPQTVAPEPKFGLKFEKTRNVLHGLTSLPGLVSNVTHADTWTIECINEVINGGTFSLTSSLNGFIKTVQVNEAIIGEIDFTIIIGSQDYILGDAFIVQTDNTGTVVRDDTKNLFGEWLIISGLNLDTDKENFDLESVYGNTNDSSWLILVEKNVDLLGNVIDWVISFRDLKTVVESNTTKFWYNDASRIIDSSTGLIVNDKISILKSNMDKAQFKGIGKNQVYDVVGSVKRSDGTLNVYALEVKATDFSGTELSGDGLSDNALQFSQFVNLVTPKDYTYFSLDINDKTQIPTTKPIQDSFLSTDNFLADGVSVDVTTSTVPKDRLLVIVNDIIQIENTDFTILSDVISFTVLPVLNDVIEVTYDDDRLESSNGLYRRNIGRNNLDFLWQHFSPNTNLIDPSTSNIIDMFVLTKGYQNNITSYITGELQYQPDAPTPLELRNTYRDLLNTKMISDTVVMHSGEIKLLFGELADPRLRCKFRIIKQPLSVLADDQLRAEVLNIITEYFVIDEWDFGDTFYNTDLMSIIHNRLPSDVASIVLVPTFVNNLFGSLLVIESGEDEIFQSSARLSDIEVVDSFNAKVIRQFG